PAVVPPGELMCTITAATLESASRSSASTRSWSLRISPLIITRAIDPDDVSARRPAGVTIMPAPTIAAIAITAASTRQNVNLRRSRRRSTITSESSDIEFSPDKKRLALHQQHHDPVMKLHQFKHNLKKTRLPITLH